MARSHQDVLDCYAGLEDLRKQVSKLFRGPRKGCHKVGGRSVMVVVCTCVYVGVRCALYV